MVLGFTGEHTQKVDGKGRMSVPADFRRVLEAEDPEYIPGGSCRMMLVYGKHLKNKLEGYSVTEFAQIMADIKSRKRSPARRRLEDMFIGSSVKIDVDKDGRAVMPAPQRAKLDIDAGELFFWGKGDHFEIYRKDVYEATADSSNEAWLAEQDDDFELLSLLDEEE